MEIGSEDLRRWYAGEALAGARFRRGEAVVITDGGHAGGAAEVLVLERLEPPTYLLRLGTGQNLMVLESALRSPDDGA